MRNWATNPIKYESIIAAEALFLTILIHLGLLLIFGYARPQAKVNPNDGGRASMLNVSALPEENQRHIMLFLEYNDPGAISRSRIDIETPAAQPVPDPVRQDRQLPEGEELEVAEPGTLPVPPAPAMPVLSTGSAGEPAPAALPALPAAVSSSGVVIKLNLNDEELALTADMELKPTTLTLSAPEPEELMGRFDITGSSGSHMLDLAAVRMLQEHRTELLSGEKLVRVVVWWQDRRREP